MFYLVDPECGETQNYETLEEAMIAGEEAIQAYREYASDGGWGDVAAISINSGPDNLDWDSVIELPVVARATEKDRVDRPDDVDEDGYSKSLGDHWLGDFDYVCDYSMVKVS